MPPTRGISCLSLVLYGALGGFGCLGLVLYGIMIGSEGPMRQQNVSGVDQSDSWNSSPLVDQH